MLSHPNQSLFHDERGFVVSAELVLISTLVVLGLITGLTAVRTSLLGELNDVADAFGSLNQSYAYTGFSAHKNCGCGLKSFTTGSAFADHAEGCEHGIVGWNQCTLDTECVGPCEHEACRKLPVEQRLQPIPHRHEHDDHAHQHHDKKKPGKQPAGKKPAGKKPSGKKKPKQEKSSAEASDILQEATPLEA